LIGVTIALVSFIMIAVLFVLSAIVEHSGVYLGLVVYILLPVVMISGLMLIPVGMFIRRKREKKHQDLRKHGWPRIDLNQGKQRKAFLIFSLGTTVFLFLSLWGSYEAFHYTESNQFCGELCHKVMEPEYTAYRHSPHARVACVDCHVGEGTEWYVRSKLSGLHQVYSTLFNKYPKPISTPIENLRPARETCEKCHWPQKFYAYKLRHETYYLQDEANTRWDLRLVIKTGPEHQAMGLREGIHWHINPDIKIEYIPGDENREELPWIRYSNLKTGESVIYRDEENPMEPNNIDDERMRLMDCIDCHNRPSHEYKSPVRFVNNALTAGEIPSELPEIKTAALELCSNEYASREEAMQTIQAGLMDFYAENHPETFARRKSDIKKAVRTLQTLFSRNVFPEMNVRWDVHLNHIGHMTTKGCFRCHNTVLRSEKDGFISRDCNLCHIITAQGKAGEKETGTHASPLEFQHPEDIGEAWKERNCSDCHQGSI